MRLLISCVCLLMALSLNATEESYPFDDPQKHQLFLELTQELRCPMCQNQNIADSDAMIANDLRRKVYQLIQQGYDRQQVVDYMKDRYGEFVSYNPPLTPATLWLWLLPVLFVLFAGFVIVQTRKKNSDELDESRLAEADKILEKEE